MLNYKIALTLLPFVGDTNGKKLLAYCGGIEEIFKESASNLAKIQGISHKVISAIKHNKDIFIRAEKEIKFIEENNIKPIFFLDKEYPQRLKQCVDSPILLFYKGNADLNVQRIVSIVGTRTPTIHGKNICHKLLNSLSQADILVVSGLAYGIDVCAHKNSMANNLKTVGVLGSGLDIIYPEANKSVAMEMIEKGGLLTEFISGTNPDRQNFPKRNRIVAGMSDIIVVVESGKKGGSLITANIGFSYNRDIAAFPGRPDDALSIGCNLLIKNDIAHLVESGEDVLKLMNWQNSDKRNSSFQRSIFVEMDENEKLLFNIINDKEAHSIDSICIESGLTMSKTSAVLLGMEFKGVLKSLPGKAYQVI